MTTTQDNTSSKLYYVSSLTQAKAGTGIAQSASVDSEPFRYPEFLPSQFSDAADEILRFNHHFFGPSVEHPFRWVDYLTQVAIISQKGQGLSVVLTDSTSITQDTPDTTKLVDSVASWLNSAFDGVDSVKENLTELWNMVLADVRPDGTNMGFEYTARFAVRDPKRPDHFLHLVTVIKVWVKEKENQYGAHVRGVVLDVVKTFKNPLGKD